MKLLIENDPRSRLPHLLFQIKIMKFPLYEIIVDYITQTLLLFILAIYYLLDKNELLLCWNIRRSFEFHG